MRRCVPPPRRIRSPRLDRLQGACILIRSDNGRRHPLWSCRIHIPDAWALSHRRDIHHSLLQHISRTALLHRRILLEAPPLRIEMEVDHSLRTHIGNHGECGAGEDHIDLIARSGGDLPRSDHADTPFVHPRWNSGQMDICPRHLHIHRGFHRIDLRPPAAAVAAGLRMAHSRSGRYGHRDHHGRKKEGSLIKEEGLPKQPCSIDRAQRSYPMLNLIVNPSRP